MSRFNETIVNVEHGTVEVRPGLTWDQVYQTLSPTGVNVVGVRIPGVGVAGLTFGLPFQQKSVERTLHSIHA